MPRLECGASAIRYGLSPAVDLFNPVASTVMMSVGMTDLMAMMHISLRAQRCESGKPDCQAQCRQKQFSKFHFFFL